MGIEGVIELTAHLDKFNNARNDKDCSVGSVGRELIEEKLGGV